MARDFLDEVIEERTTRNPAFPRLVEEASRRRAQLRELAAVRAAEGLSQAVVADRMGTSPSVVARIESGESDAKLSTLARYAEALGKRLTWRVG